MWLWKGRRSIDYSDNSNGPAELTGTRNVWMTLRSRESKNTNHTNTMIDVSALGDGVVLHLVLQVSPSPIFGCANLIPLTDAEEPKNQIYRSGSMQSTLLLRRLSDIIIFYFYKYIFIFILYIFISFFSYFKYIFTLYTLKK